MEGACWAMLCLVSQPCLTLCDPMDCGPQAPLSLENLQARILKWAANPPPGDIPNPGLKPRSPALQAYSWPSEPPGKPKNTGVGSLFFSGGSSWSRSRTKMSFIAGGFFTSWATREAWRELNGALGLNNWYWDVKQSYAFRKRIYWPGDFLQLEFKLSALSSSIWGLRLSAFICELRACDCSQ